MGWWATALTVAGALGALLVDSRLGYGIAVGGGIALLLFAVYRVLAPAMLAAPTQRRPRVVFWLVWCAKWPVVAAALYVSFRHGAAAPAGVAVGAGILPAVATGMALRAVLADAWRSRRRRT